MKKALSILLAGFVVLSTTPGYAQQIGPALGSATISASGTLASSNSLQVTLVNASGTAVTGGLTFNPTGTFIGTAGVAAPQIVRVQFASNAAGFQSIIVSTDNRRTTSNSAVYTGDGTGSGLVGVTDSKEAAPLHWTVFDELTARPNDSTGAAGYTFKAFTSGADAGKIENTTQFFVVDKQQDKANFTPKPAAFNTNGVLGFASVIAGVNGTEATLANAPYNADNPATTNTVEGRSITDGTAYMRFAVDYTGQSAQAYKTDTLTLEMVTLT